MSVYNDVTESSADQLIFPYLGKKIVFDRTWYIRKVALIQ